jgi:hypothetical protein
MIPNIARIMNSVQTQLQIKPDLAQQMTIITFNILINKINNNKIKFLYLY